MNYLKSHHFNPGVVTRGYGGKSKVWPQVVNHNSDPLLVGDEAVLISQNTKVPVIAGSNRANNAEILVRNFNCNVIVSDDGLQHYALQRDIEIVVIDGMRRFGNKLCLPAGPLREPLSRLTSIDFMVTNGAAHKNEFSMQFVIDGIVSVKNENIKCDIATLRHQKIIAIAGIGNPERFFESLTSLGISFDAIAFPDHHSFQKKDFDHRHADIILMTEKDAVKCRGFADDRFYVAKGRGVVDDAFFKAVLQKLMRWLTQ
ncbi:MAG: hypothetical protein ACD_42C00229G0001 [uncultured bacterium]|nr:MAG: hypothetical protein ACD_42C00229G0001 [uncultured bacterium]